MPIDLATQKPLSLKEATKLFPAYREGHATHVARLMRMILKGSRDQSGGIVRLEALKLGGQWVTTVEAIQEFGQRLSAPIKGTEAAPAVPAHRRASHNAAKKLLEQAGF